jgi:hypothetical protein
MASERDLLNDQTRENLKSLCKELDINYEHSWKKEEFVEALAKSHKIKKMGIEELTERIAKCGNVKEAMRSGKQEIYNEIVQKVFWKSDELASEIAKIVAVGEIIDPGLINDLKTQITDIKESKICKIGEMKKVQPHIWNAWSPKQQNAYYGAFKVINHIPKFTEKINELALADRHILKYLELNERKLPDRVKYYASQAYRCHIAKCYDGCIVMLARALEYSLKELFKIKKIEFRERDTLGQLKDTYIKRIGQDKIVEQILIVENMDRIICAHDKPPYEKLMHIEDSDLAWSVAYVIFRDILP